MATLWETITENSTLPVEPGNTLLDHVNHQVSGVPFPVQQLEVNFAEVNSEVNFTEEENEVSFKDTTQEVNINLDSVGVDNVIQ